MVGILKMASSGSAVLGSLFLSTLLSSTYAQTTAKNTSVPFSAYTAKGENEQAVVAVNVPEGVDKADLYFHFEAPADGYAWAAFGMGSRMDKALMFVVYRSQDNQGEPTISPRIGSSHNMPEFTNAVNISVLDGSSVIDGKFTANFHCQGCRDWGVSSVDASSTAAPFILALGPAGDLQSDDKEVQISRHSQYENQWTLNMKQATGINGVPVIDGSSNSGSNTSDNDDDDYDGPGSTVFITRSAMVHGFLMCFAFTIIFPGGYLFLRVFDRVWLHAGIQTFGLIFVLLGMGAGIRVSLNEQISPNMGHPHQIIGLIIVALVIISWAIGLVGHLSYRRTQVPHPVMKGHRIVGPLSITLGFINACLGLSWVGANRAIIGYTIFNVLVLIIVGSLVFMKKKRKMRQSAQNSAAANNFREGEFGQPFGGPPPAYNAQQQHQQAQQGYGQNVPMQTFASQGEPEHGRVEYYNVQPNK